MCNTSKALLSLISKYFILIQSKIKNTLSYDFKLINIINFLYIIKKIKNTFNNS